MQSEKDLSALQLWMDSVTHEQREREKERGRERDPQCPKLS